MISKTRAGAVIAIGAGLALAVSSCAGGAPSASDSGGEPLIFGAELSYTASGSNSGPAHEAGIRARFEMENAAGGIDGHPLQLVTADDALDPAKAPAGARTLVEDENVLAMTTSGSNTALAVQSYLAEHQVLGFNGGASTALIESQDSTYRLYNPSYGELGGRIAQYAIEQLGYTKIGIAYTPDAIGEPFRDGALQVIQAAGLQAAAVVEFSAGATDASSQAAQLKQSGAQIVLINHVPSVDGLIINAAETIDYHPDYGSTFVATNSSMLSLYGDVLNDRIYFASPFVLPTADEAATYREWLAKVAGDVDYHDSDALNGWTEADAVVAVLKQAVEDAGGAVPTREQVLTAASDIHIADDYLLGLSWSATDYTGVDQARILGMQDGAYYEADPPADNPVSTVLPG